MIKRNYMVLILTPDDHKIEYFDTPEEASAHVALVDKISPIADSHVFKYVSSTDEFSQQCSAELDVVVEKKIKKPLASISLAEKEVIK